MVNGRVTDRNFYFRYKIRSLRLFIFVQKLNIWNIFRDRKQYSTKKQNIKFIINV